MYDTRLDAIIKAADLGSFSKAAQALGYSIPALVKQINGFETQMGVTLFERSNKGVKLTTSGKEFVEDAKSIIEQCNLAIQKAQSNQVQTDSIIRVGVSLYQSGQRILELCQQLYMRDTGLSIQFAPIGDTFESYKEVVENFEETIDVFGSTYLAGVDKTQCSIVTIANPYLCMAVPATDKLTLTEPLAVEDFKGRRIHVPEPGNPYVDAARAEIERLAPDVQFIEFRHYDVSVFDECAMLGDLLLSKEIWRSVHPLMVTMDVQWDKTEPYCLYFAKEPRPAVARFVELLKEISRNAER